MFGFGKNDDKDLERAKDGMVVNVVLPATAVDVSVLVNEKDYEAAMEVVREYEKRENGD